MFCSGLRWCLFDRMTKFRTGKKCACCCRVDAALLRGMCVCMCVCVCCVVLLLQLVVSCLTRCNIRPIFSPRIQSSSRPHSSSDPLPLQPRRLPLCMRHRHRRTHRVHQQVCYAPTSQPNPHHPLPIVPPYTASASVKDVGYDYDSPVMECHGVLSYGMKVSSCVQRASHTAPAYQQPPPPQSALAGPPAYSAGPAPATAASSTQVRPLRSDQ
jgi:hypothetical protein